MNNTVLQYKQIIKKCQIIFEKKNKDYGTAWRILRLPAITDQIMIKAKRIRAIQDKIKQQITDSMDTEFMGIINYCILALIQIELKNDKRINITLQELMTLYTQVVDNTLSLLYKKNHDYQEAWRDMRIISITDIILMKLLRIKKIEENNGKVLISEGISANYQDILNYAVFALIHLIELDNVNNINK